MFIPAETCKAKTMENFAPTGEQEIERLVQKLASRLMNCGWTMATAGAGGCLDFFSRV